MLPEGTPITSDRFNIKAIADSLIVLVLCALLVREPIHQVREEFGRLSGRRADPDLDDLVRGAIDEVIAEHADQDSHAYEIVDVMTVRRGKITEADLRVGFTGALTQQEQDDIRAATLLELTQRLGPVRLYLMFPGVPIHQGSIASESAPLRGPADGHGPSTSSTA